MSQQILIKRSSVAGKTPTTVQLSLGELAINTYDGKVFLKKNVLGTESIVEVGATTLTGDVTGSGNGSIALTLSATGVAAGTYTKLTVDTKGRVTAGSTLAATDIPSLDWSKITSGKPTTLAGYGITDAVGRGEYRNFGITAINPVAGVNATCTTAQFISFLTTLGMFNYSHAALKTTWDYAGNNDIIDTGFGQLELAGCVVETFTNGDGNKHVRVTRPTTGSGLFQVLVYNDQGSTYQPGWRSILTNENGAVINPATPKDGDIQVAAGVVKIYATGAWRQVFPAVYA